MECPAEKMQKDESYQTLMLIAAGSAMAANCEPCLNRVIPNLIEAGVPDSEIRRAAEIGQCVKDREADIIKEAADVLAGTSFLDTEIPEACPRDQMDPLTTDKTGMLIAVGAAVAGNCDSCLRAVVQELREQGVTCEEIRTAVEVGLTVKEKPAAVVKQTADELTAEPAEVAVSL
jgi:AhpD family alkylhydroperoxidase